jgi:osmotically-inducible protein OsmY
VEDQGMTGKAYHRAHDPAPSGRGILDQARQSRALALHSDLRIRDTGSPIRLALLNGDLAGDVAGLGRKRLAGVLAWWVPGSRDVINGLGVTPPERDGDEAITDAVRQVPERDPLVDATMTEMGTRQAVVTLLGSVPSATQRDCAEADAWYVLGVDDVVNRLDVQP